jgi:hypothetical protein
MTPKSASAGIVSTLWFCAVLVLNGKVAVNPMVMRRQIRLSWRAGRLLGRKGLGKAIPFDDNRHMTFAVGRKSRPLNYL